MRLRFFSLFMALMCLPLVAFAPQADARAGSGRSMGSRGSHTWSDAPRTSLTPNWSRPMERSVTPQAPPSSMGRGGMGMGASSFGSRAMGQARPPFTARHPFLSGLAGGFIGAGLFGMLSGHGFFSGFSGGGGSFFGFLFQVLIIAGIISLLIRLWKKPRLPNTAGQSDNSSFGGTSTNAFGPSSQPNSTPVSLSQEDYTAFQNLLVNVQEAWSNQDIAALQRLATPEMVSYFNEQLSNLTSRGARNIVSQVQFLRGDLSESWRENDMTYATVALRYSLIDVTTDSMGNVIDGSRTEPQTVTELWTFARAEGRGNWILSAIQQAG